MVRYTSFPLFVTIIFYNTIFLCPFTKKKIPYFFLQNLVIFFLKIKILLFYSYVPCIWASVRLFLWSLKWELGFCSFQFDKWKLTNLIKNDLRKKNRHDKRRWYSVSVRERRNSTKRKMQRKNRRKQKNIKCIIWFQSWLIYIDLNPMKKISII